MIKSKVIIQPEMVLIWTKKEGGKTSGQKSSAIWGINYRENIHRKEKNDTYLSIYNFYKYQYFKEV